MNSKSALSVLLVLVLATTLATIPAGSAQGGPDGPRMNNLLVKLYAGVDQEFTALELNEIDTTDWPLTKYWSDRWKAPPYATQIAQVPYNDMGMREFDINNQRWPTGVTEPRDWDPSSASFKNWFDETDIRHQRAWCFRVAIARLTNKPAWSTEILKGFGKSVDSFVPDPAAGAWIWPGFRATPVLTYDMPFGIEDEPYHHDYSVARAEQILDAAGFTLSWYGDPDGGGPLETKWWRIDPTKTPPNNVLDLLVGVTRADDPLRLDYGRRLNTELINVGIPTEHNELAKSAAFDKVMKYYNYHWYTGGWGLGADPDHLYDLFHSSMYWGGDETTYYGGDGYSLNYAGFVNAAYDTAADLVKYPVTLADAMTGAYESQRVFAKYSPVIPLYAMKSVMAYRTGWDGFINYEGEGVYSSSNIQSTMNGYNPAPTLAETLRVGYMSNLEAPNVITSEWTWDWQILGFVYDSLIGRDPFNLPQDSGWLAKPRGAGVDGELGTVDDAFFTQDPGDWDTGKMAITFTVRPDAVWHDGVTPVTAKDVKFSLLFTRDAGAGVAWNFASAMNIQFVEIQEDDPDLGQYDIKIYFGCKSYWAAHWAGFLPIISKNIWMAANAKYGWGYPEWGSPTKYKAAYVSSVTPGASFDTGESAVRDVNGDDHYGAGDVLLVGPTPFANAKLVPFTGLKEGFERYADTTDDNTWGVGEPVVLDNNNNTVYDAGDVVLAGVAPPLGTELRVAGANDKHNERITVDTRDKKPGVPCEFEVSNLVKFADSVSTYRDGKWHIDEKTLVGDKYYFELTLMDGAGEPPEVGDTMVDAAVAPTDWDASLVREYEPYATWDLSVSDGNSNGKADMIEDGTGPWIYQNMDQLLSVSASFTANRNFYMTQGDATAPWGLDEIYDYLFNAWHRVGDVNYDKTITAAGDGVRIARALGTNYYEYPYDESGTKWDYYNPHADLDYNEYCDAMDLYYYGKHYLAVGFPPYGL